MRPKGATIRSNANRTISVGDKAAHSLKADILMIGTLHVSLISINIIIVESFILHFRLLIWVYPATVITLARTI